MARATLPPSPLALCLTHATPRTCSARAAPQRDRMSSPVKKPPAYHVDESFTPLPSVKFVRQQLRGGPSAPTGSLYTAHFSKHQTLAVDVCSAPGMTTLTNDRSGATPLGVSVETHFKAKLESAARKGLAKVCEGGASDMPVETARVFRDLDITNGYYYNGCVPGLETAKGHVVSRNNTAEESTVELMSVRFKVEQRDDGCRRVIDFKVKNGQGELAKGSLTKMAKSTFRLLITVNLWVSDDTAKMSLSIRGLRAVKMRRDYVHVPALHSLAVGGVEAVEADESLKAAAGKDAMETDSGAEDQLSDDGALAAAESLDGIGHAERRKNHHPNRNTDDAAVEVVESQDQAANGETQLAEGLAKGIKQETVKARRSIDEPGVSKPCFTMRASSRVDAPESPDDVISPYKAAVAARAFEIKYRVPRNAATLTMVKGSTIGVRGFFNSTEGEQARAEFDTLPEEGFQHIVEVSTLIRLSELLSAAAAAQIVTVSLH